MKLSSAIQEALIALLCYDETEGSTVALMIEAKHFDPVYREIATLAIDYRERHKQAPGTHTLDLFDVASERDQDRAELFNRLFESVKSTAGKINPRYVLDCARHFVRHQGLKRAMASALRDLEKDDEAGLLSAEATLTTALSASLDVYDPGTKFIEDPERSLAFLETFDASLPTGIPALDYNDLGPAPGRLHLYIGPAKSGKSWWMVNLMTRAHQHVKRVLYVSMEMSEAEICQRLVQSFFSMSKRSIDGLAYRKFVETENRKDWGTEWDIVKLREIEHLMEPDVRANLLKKLDVFKGGERMFVKTFPMGTLSSKNLDAYLDLLEHRERFVPDLVLMDYADIMKMPPKMERWEGVIDVSQNLRRIAQERYLAMATASQTKISGATAKRIEGRHVGGAWDKIATADTIITYSQTDEERTDGLARLYVAGGRSDKDKFEVMISQKYEIGQFVLSSIRLGERYYKEDEKAG